MFNHFITIQLSVLNFNTSSRCINIRIDVKELLRWNIPMSRVFWPFNLHIQSDGIKVQYIISLDSLWKFAYQIYLMDIRTGILSLTDR